MNRIFFFILFVIGAFWVKAQETLPIYSDYLSDNVYLVHPAAAGVGNCAKLRLTGRNQWSGVANAPELQTLSYHMRVGYNNGVGMILFNDKNGYHSRQGVQLTYAYHIDMGAGYDTNQLSFGLSFMAVNNKLDESNFTINDPVITQIVQSTGYYNADFGMSYHMRNFFSYITVKNVLLNARNLYNDDFESLNLRKYLATIGYYHPGKSMQFEPSVMAQYVERTGEKFIDLNLKVYKKFSEASVWAGLSYRKGFDGGATEELNYITPILGVSFKKFMLAYTYSKQTGDILFDDASYHQISLGLDLFCTPPRRNGCPNINGSF